MGVVSKVFTLTVTHLLHKYVPRDLNVDKTVRYPYKMLRLIINNTERVLTLTKHRPLLCPGEENPWGCLLISNRNLQLEMKILRKTKPADKCLLLRHRKQQKNISNIADILLI